VKDGEIYVIEVNPRASRTVPFVSKAQGQPYAKIAAKLMMGQIAARAWRGRADAAQACGREGSRLPFLEIPRVDVILGPEMRSTGEVMGIDQNFPMAYAKAQIAAGSVLPTKGPSSFPCGTPTSRRWCRWRRCSPMPASN